uniref:Uncharacterized protein n=1 Tax=Manihot esculenta TaxID=3983 RepID=A0A2C9VWJ4_MANES
MYKDFHYNIITQTCSLIKIKIKLIKHLELKAILSFVISILDQV